uniref:Uncharacterized protein n=1 Tax=Glossina palpalis gambiensis TaxID=67801 RepID=A0A1B0B5P1_9MUSC
MGLLLSTVICGSGWVALPLLGCIQLFWCNRIRVLLESYGLLLIEYNENSDNKPAEAQFDRKFHNNF